MSKLTPKQRKFVKAYIATDNASEAGRIAYPNPEPVVAAQIGRENLQKPTVKAEIDKILAKHEIDLDNAILPIAKGLKASKIDQYTGEVSDDISTQLKASDRALKLLGVSEGSSGSLHLHLHSQRDKYNI